MIFGQRGAVQGTVWYRHFRFGIHCMQHFSNYCTRNSPRSSQASNYNFRALTLRSSFIWSNCQIASSSSIYMCVLQHYSLETVFIPSSYLIHFWASSLGSIKEHPWFRIWALSLLRFSVALSKANLLIQLPGQEALKVEVVRRMESAIIFWEGEYLKNSFFNI